MKRVLENIYYFYPVQLLVLHFQRNQLFLVFWLLLFLSITGNFGSDFGIPYLYLDPEYLEQVDYVSFFILGAAFGGFLMVWNITTYILNTHRFDFMASLKRPFSMFVLNNSLLPLSFIITYCIITYRFQSQNEFTGDEYIILDVLGFLGGMLIVLFLTGLYFETTNRNIFNLLSKVGGKQVKPVNKITRRVQLRQDKLWEDYRSRDGQFRVKHFFSVNFRFRLVRSVKHYDEAMKKSVFRQNHSNALIIQLVTIALLVALGMLIEYPFFRIPAGASVLLFMSVIVSIIGIFNFWLGRWSFVFFVGALLAANYFLSADFIMHKNKAYGLNYLYTPAEYSSKRLENIASHNNVQFDHRNTERILENWKSGTNQQKPKIVFLNFSGGGLRAAMYSMLAVQEADSLLNGRLLEHTVLMTGASGGMIGAAYLRELYLRKKLGEVDSFYHHQYAYDVGKDLLNPVAFTIVTNDLFYPWQTFKVGDFTYKKDRGYMMERQLHENTHHLMDKTIGDYKLYEQQGIIPMMVFTPAIINDDRKLIISAQKMSFLMRPPFNNLQPDYNDIDAVDYNRLFELHHAPKLRLSSAIRMNATFPYILPNVTLPTEPPLSVMDAGFRDNFGQETSMRFLYEFSDWVNQNTSGVVILQVRAFERKEDIEDPEQESILSSTFKPVAALYNNWTRMQDFNQSYQLSYLSGFLDVPLNIITMEYKPEGDDNTSLSFHLTTKEKSDIHKAIGNEDFRDDMRRLKAAMGE